MICSHPITFDELDLTSGDRWRSCLTCGVTYNRTKRNKRLERAMRDRYALPRSPWSAPERSDEAIW